VKAIALGLAILLTPTAPSHSLPDKRPPIDQCTSDPSFANFKHGLQQAVARKDGKALIALLSPHVLVNFGGASGPAAFAQAWDLSSDANDIWDLLQMMLQMGCARDKGARIIPSLSIQLEPFFEQDVDLSDKRLAFPGAKVTRDPDASNSTIATLSWEFVDAVDTSADSETRVKLADGREGWVADDELYEPVGYRMIVEKLHGKWMITAFVAGD
jgi:hypothetical protein